MTLRLTIDEQGWRAHVDAMRAATPDLVPVVKGNGYGFGRAALAAIAASFADEVAVGTVHELADVVSATPSHVTVVALTPAVHLHAELPPRSVPTVAAPAHVDALDRLGHPGPVAVKLESPMHRHGTSPADLPHMLSAIRSGGRSVHQFVLHLPMPSASYTAELAISDVERWLPDLDPSVPVSLSHLTAACFDEVRTRHPERSFRLRSGTALWHGDKSSLHLSADVLHVRRVTAGEPVGYRLTPAPTSGWLIMVGAGSAHGVAPLDDGLSPFHHARHRMALVEPPHMHTSMAIVGDDMPSPSVGEWVDVQRPLIAVTADLVEWR
jgi:alanine racemase